MTGFLADPSNPDAVYRSAFGVYASFDAGANYGYSGTGLDKASVNALVPVPGSPGSYLAATEGVGVQRTDDDGESWRVTNTGVVGQTLQLAADPTDGDVFFLVAGGHLWKTNDGAAHWSLSDTGLPYGASAVAIDQSSRRSLTAVNQTVYRPQRRDVRGGGSTLPAPGGAAGVWPSTLRTGTASTRQRTPASSAQPIRAPRGSRCTALRHRPALAQTATSVGVDSTVFRWGPTSSAPTLVRRCRTGSGVRRPRGCRQDLRRNAAGVYQSIDAAVSAACDRRPRLDFITDLTSITSGHLMVKRRGDGQDRSDSARCHHRQADEITRDVRPPYGFVAQRVAATAFFEYDQRWTTARRPR